jgi:hypothetical protein
MSFMLNEQYEHLYESWWYHHGDAYGKGPVFKYSESWPLADILPRHLWWYGLAHIDSSNQPSGWTRGDILAEDWYGTNGIGDFNHLQFAVGTVGFDSGREPVIANESSTGSNYCRLQWQFVKKRIEEVHGHEWNRVPLMIHAAYANADEPEAGCSPARLYGPSGPYQG